jgi:hypothetical protein
VRTGQAGEWAKVNQKKASGHASRFTPETARGFKDRTTRQGIRVWCGECKELRAIDKCVSVQEETENSSTYLVSLDQCGHQRSVTQSVEFTPSVKERRGWTKETESQIPEIEPIDPERAELLDAMRDARLDG